MADWLGMMIRMFPFALIVAACSPSGEPAVNEDAANQAAAEVDAAIADAAANAGAPVAEKVPPPLPPKVETTAIARAEVLATWESAENRTRCAPLGFTRNGGVEGSPRRAHFSGGWAVAFDRPGERSLYGVAGTGVALKAFEVERARVTKQWPYSRSLGNKLGDLPAEALAGYGVEGASAYPKENADGAGLNSLAYVLIPGQRCLYNVWSHRGRAHLEALLDGLTLIKN